MSDEIELDLVALRQVAEKTLTFSGGYGWSLKPGVIYESAPSVICDHPDLVDAPDLQSVCPETWGEDAEHIATFDPPTVLALLDRLEKAEGVL